MKKNGNIKMNGNGQTSQRLRVEFNHSTAKAVAIAGSFNDWRPDSTPMVELNNGRWLKELTLPPGTYEYCFVMDGTYLPDPLAKETTANPFGGLNSILKVENRVK